MRQNQLTSWPPPSCNLGHAPGASSAQKYYRLIGLSLQVNALAGLFLENKHDFAKSGSVNTRGYPFPVY